MNQPHTKNVLVSGVGAVIGYGIIRNLRENPEPIRIIGLDIFSDAVGQHWCDQFIQAPYSNDPNYINFLNHVIKKHQIHIAFPGIEQDVTCWSNNRHQLPNDTHIVLNSAQLIHITNDKWLTHQKLIEHNIQAIPTEITGDFKALSTQLGLPFLMKPRQSYAGKGMYTIETAEDFQYWRRKQGDNFMAQKIVGSNDTEYTVGVFGNGVGDVLAQISFKRQLSGEGATSKAEVYFNSALEETVQQLARIFKPKGPCNFQFREDNGHFLLLEINPRISSSTSIRSKFGYNESQMSLNYYAEKTITQPTLKPGKVVRYIEDVILT